MYFELILKIVIWQLTGLGLYQLGKWLWYDKPDNWFKTGWNYSLQLFGFIIYMVTFFYLLEENM